VRFGLDVRSGQISRADYVDVPVTSARYQPRGLTRPRWSMGILPWRAMTRGDSLSRAYRRSARKLALPYSIDIIAGMETSYVNPVLKLSADFELDPS
jgi:hypothetical protein